MRNVNESTVISRVISQQRSGPIGGDEGGDGSDPLAQSFNVGGGLDDVDGRFVTSIDVFFSAKDATLPCQVEIRNMINGYPGR